VVVGSSNTDMVVKVPRLPGPGETVIGGEFVTAAGGKGANQAVACARAGASVCLVARVGDDAFGRSAIGGLERARVNTDYVVSDAEATSGVALILVDDEGENIIAVAPGANMRLTPEDVERVRPVVERADCLLLQLEVPLAAVQRAVSIAHDAHTLIVLNPAPAPAEPVPPAILAAVDVLTPNRAEAEALLRRPVRTVAEASQAAQELCHGGAKRVIITLGREGAVGCAGQPVHVPGHRVKAIDAVAAGDAFSAALAVALSEGMDFADACRFANAAGACAVTRLGAQPSMPTRADIEAMLTRQGP
jgi:ribokinase